MLAFYNPHVDDFLSEPPHFRLLKRRPLKKYGYLLEGEIRRHGRVNVEIDATISAFVPDRYFSLLPGFVRKLISKLEYFIWIKINQLDDKVACLTDADKKNEYILLAFSYKAATGALFNRRLDAFRQYARCVMHLSHYFVSTSLKSTNLRKIENVMLAGDSDISSNAYFKHHFAWYENKIILLPFSVSDRFEVNVPFDARESLCVATGTYHDLKQELPAQLYRDYLAFFSEDTYHPVRKLIKNKHESLSDYIVCNISLYRSGGNDTLLSKALKHLNVSQKQYFAINIVDLYNSYRYAIVGEENVGFPALGAFEAMACGCVLIAQPSYYQGLGIQPGVHYYPHEGSLDSIVAAIRALREDMTKAQEISQAGEAYINANCRAGICYQNAMRALTDGASYD